MTDRDSPNRRQASCRVMVVLTVATLVVRIGILAAMPAAMPGALVEDPDAYRATAVNLVEHGCFGSGDTPSATRPILYPLILAGCRLVDPGLWYSVATLHVVLGVATVLLTYLLALRWGLGRWAPAAAGLVVIDPILLMQSTLVMTETMATLLAVGGLAAATECARRPGAGRAAVCGAVLAAAVLCRPTFLIWTAAVVVLLPWFARTWFDRARVFHAMVVAAGLLLCPWVVRNAEHFGKATPATNHGGFTLLLANNPSFYEYLRTAEVGERWNADQFNAEWKHRANTLCPGDEVAADRLAYADATATIRGEPGTFAHACVVRVARTWGVVPHRTADSESRGRRLARYAVGAFYSLVSLIAVVGAFYGLVSLAAVVGVAAGVRGGIPRETLLVGWLWGLLLVGSFTAVHGVYWTNMRMRAPLVPVVCLVVGLGIGRIASRADWRK